MAVTDPHDPHAYRRALECLVGIPATDGNRVAVLRNGDEIFPAMLAAIQGARRTVDLLTYVYWTGPPADAIAACLADRARAGVRVRVLIDAIGGRLIDHANVERMREAGALVEFFRPVPDSKVWRATHRTHRRVLVVDGTVAFTGGVGIAGEWSGDARRPGEWRETQLRIEGPAVAGLRAAFLENWAETPHPLIDADEQVPPLEPVGEVPVMVVRSSASHGVSPMSILKRLLIDLARERVRITTAYLAPDEGAMEAIARARGRGVQIQLMVPGEHIDKRVAELAAWDQFEALLDLGVEIHTYERTMLHAKVLTVDGVLADVGSANFNARSLSQDEEVDVVVFDREVVAVLDRHFDDDLAASERVTQERFESRGMLRRIGERVVGLVDDVM